MPQRNAKETPAARRANEALDRVTGKDKTPVKKALAFLLEGSHDEPAPDAVPAQTKPNPSPDLAQIQNASGSTSGELSEIPTETLDRPKVAQSQSNPSPIAPERNFNKRANSLERSALPAGQFPGASKKIYDALYVRTRGAVVPTRMVQARHRELLAWSGVKDIKTIKTHLNKLREQGLIAWQTLKGEHEGSFYEIFLPEEVGSDLDLAQSQPNPSPGQKTDLDLAQFLGWAGLGNRTDSKGLNPNDKTSFKTNTENDDDEAFADLLADLKRAVREVTGREASPSERVRWKEVSDILVTELKIAAGRTTVSSVPAFLAEHLRRRLWKKEKRQLDDERVKEQATATTKVNASECPDCFGTGMWYPEGFEKGVARCEHKALAKQES